MARKIIGFYNEGANDSTVTANQLIVEIGHHQFACFVKSGGSGEVEAFELFQLDEVMHEWSEVFYEIRQYSMLLNKTYSATHLYYNFEEAVIMPAEQKGIVASEDYLALLFGESERYEMKYDKIGKDEQIINAYRVKRNISELAGRYFLLHRVYHSYSPLLEEILAQHQQEDKYIKVQFYSNHLVVAVIKDKQLQLVQSFNYRTTEDVLYYLLNTAQQFQLETHSTPLEISGLFDPGSGLHGQLQQLFDQIFFDELPACSMRNTITEAGYPAHYFTPFFKLAQHEDHIG